MFPSSITSRGRLQNRPFFAFDKNARARSSESPVASRGLNGVLYWGETPCVFVLSKTEFDGKNPTVLQSTCGP